MAKRLESYKLLDCITLIENIEFIEKLIIECLEFNRFRYMFKHGGKYNFIFTESENSFQLMYVCNKSKVFHSIGIQISKNDTIDSLKKKWGQFVKSVTFLGKHKFI